MAKKIANEQNPVEQDDLDDLDLDLDLPDIGIAHESENRKPIRSLSIGFAQGVKDDLADKTKAFNRIKDILPESYGTTLDVADTTLGTVTNLYQTLKHETQDGVRSLKKATADLVKPHQEKMPDWLSKRIDALLATDDTGARLKADQGAIDDEAIQQTLGSIFKLQMEHSEKTKEEQTAEGVFKEAVEEKRHFSLTEALNGIRRGVDQQVAYQDQITSRFQQKLIELQYRTYFTNRDQLAVQEKMARDIKEALQSVVKNTALPEYRKLHLSESVGQSLREKFSTGAQEKITGLGSQLFGRVAGRLKEQVSTFSKTLNQQLKEGAGLVSEMGANADVINPLQLIGMLGGGAVSEEAMNFIAPRVRKLLEKQGIVSETGENLQQYMDDLPRMLNEYAQKNMGGMGVNSWLSELIGDSRVSSSLEYQQIEDGDQPAMYDRLTRQSIVEVIPGYLSRIHLELKQFRQGMGVSEPDDDGRLRFDLKTRDFKQQRSTRARIGQEVLSETNREGMHNQLNEIIEALDIKGEVDPLEWDSVEKQLKTLLLGTHFQGRRLSLDQLSDASQLGQMIDEHSAKVISDALTNRYQGEVDYTENGDRVFNYTKEGGNQERINKAKHAFNRIHQHVKDPKGKIQGYVSTGYEEALRELGFVKRKADGTPLIDYKALFESLVENQPTEASPPQTEGFDDNSFTPSKTLTENEREALRKEQSKSLIDRVLNRVRGQEGSGTESEEQSVPPEDLSQWGVITEIPNQGRGPQRPPRAEPTLGEHTQQSESSQPPSESERTSVLSNYRAFASDTLSRIGQNARERVGALLQRPPSDVESTQTPSLPEYVRASRVIEPVERSIGDSMPITGPTAIVQRSGRILGEGAQSLGQRVTGALKREETEQAGDEASSDANEPGLWEIGRRYGQVMGEGAQSLGQRVTGALKREETKQAGDEASSDANEPGLWEIGRRYGQVMGEGAQSLGQRVTGALKREETEQVGEAADDEKLTFSALLGRYTEATKALFDDWRNNHEKQRLTGQQPPPPESLSSGLETGRGVIVPRPTEQTPLRSSTQAPVVAPPHQPIAVDHSPYQRWATGEGRVFDYTTPPPITQVTGQPFFDPRVIQPTQTVMDRPQRVEGSMSPIQESSPLVTHLQRIRQLLEGEEEGVARDIRTIRERLDQNQPISPDEAHFAVLTRLLETVEGIAQYLTKDDEESWFNILDIGKKTARTMSKVGSALGSYYLGALKMLGGGMGGIGHLALGAGRGIGRGLSNLVSKRSSIGATDVYLKGQPDQPVLTAKGFEEKQYHDSQTGEPIGSVDELKKLQGDVVDTEGNLIVTAGQLTKGLRDRLGQPLGGAGFLQGVASAVGQVANVAFTPYRMIGAAAKGVIGLGSKVINRVKDVYVKGERRPRLLATVMKNGGYISASTGRPLYTLKDLDGAVTDRQGNLVLSHEDIQQGLVDWKGESFGFLDRQLNRIKALAKVPLSAAKLGFNVVKWEAKMLHKGAKAVGGATKAIAQMGARTILGNSPIAPTQPIGASGVGEINEHSSFSVQLFGFLENIRSNVAQLRDYFIPDSAVIGSPDRSEPKRLEEDRLDDVEEEEEQQETHEQEQAVDQRREQTTTLMTVLEAIKAQLAEKKAEKKAEKERSKWDSDYDDNDLRDNSWKEWMANKNKEKEDKEQVIEERRDEKDGSFLDTLKKLAMPLIGLLTGALTSVFNKFKGLFDGLDFFKNRAGGADGADRSRNRSNRNNRNNRGSQRRGFFRQTWNLTKKAGGYAVAGAATLGRATVTAGKVAGRAAVGAAKTAWRLGGHAVRFLGSQAVRHALRGIAVKGALILAKAGATIAAGAGVVISAPVVITAAAVAAVAVGGYFAWRYFKGRKIDEFTKYRLYQYGVDPNNEDQAAKILALEKTLKGNVSEDEDGFHVDEGVDMAQVAKGFGVEPNDEEHLGEFLVWFNGRFLPVYVTSLNVLKKLNSSIGFGSIDELSVKEKIAYLNATKTVAPTNEDWADPYEILVSPFGAGLLGIKIADITQFREDLLERLEQEQQKEEGREQRRQSRRNRRGKRGPGHTSVNEQEPEPTEQTHLSNRVIGQTATQTTALTQARHTQGQRALSVEERLFSKTNEVKLLSPVEAITFNRNNKERKLMPVEGVLFHVMGLKTLTREHIEPLQQLCEWIDQATLYKTDGKAEWSGDPELVFFKHRHLFGSRWHDEEHQQQWLDWFKYRFLPVYLTYLTHIRQHYLSPSVALKGLVNQYPLQLEVSKQLMNLELSKEDELVSVWSIAESPWESLEINRDITTVYPFIEHLKHVVSLKKKSLEGGLVEGMSVLKMGTHTTETPPKEHVDTQPPKRQVSDPAQSKTPLRRDNITSGFDASSPAEQKAIQYNEQYHAQGSAWSQSSELGATGSQANAFHPGGGTGGDVNDLPLPKGDGSWKAHKELIVAASEMAGVDPGLMATMAAIESGFRANVKARTSSAKGLYQFIDSTWRETLKKHGAKYGIAPNAHQFDPRANVLMGAEFLKDNAKAIKPVIDGPVTDTHLYAAHFLGAGGARTLFRASPNTNAPRLMPKPANANVSIFYDKGRPRTVSEVYAELNRRVATRRDKYAEEARALAKQVSQKTTTADADQGEPIEEVENTALTPQFSPIDPSDTVEQSPVMRPTQSLAQQAVQGSSAPSAPMGGSSAASAPGVAPAGNTTMAASSAAVSPGSVGQAIEVLKKRTAGRHIDVEHLESSFATQLMQFIQDIESQTGRKLVINSAYRPPTNKEKKALQSPGTTQAQVSSSPLAASIYGSMHGRGEAIDIKYTDIGKLGNMNKMSQSDRQLWFQTAKKHGLNLPLLGGAMGPGTGRKGSTFIEWWHLEPNKPFGGRRGDLKLRGQEHAEHIASRAAKTALASGAKPSDSPMPEALGSSSEEGSAQALAKIDDATQNANASSTAGNQTTTITGDSRSNASGLAPATGSSAPMGGVLDSKEAGVHAQMTKQAATSGQGQQTALPHPTVIGKIQPAQFTHPVEGTLSSIRGLLHTAQQTPSAMIRELTNTVDSVTHQPTARQRIATPASIDSSGGIDQAFNRNTEQLHQQQRQRTQQAQVKNDQEQQRHIQGNESLGSIQTVLEHSLTTQQTMDGRLRELVLLANVLSKGKGVDVLNNESPAQTTPMVEKKHTTPFRNKARENKQAGLIRMDRAFTL